MMVLQKYRVIRKRGRWGGRETERRGDLILRKWLTHVRRLTNLKSTGQPSKLEAQGEGMLHLEFQSNWLGLLYREARTLQLIR